MATESEARTELQELSLDRAMGRVLSVEVVDNRLRGIGKTHGRLDSGRFDYDAFDLRELVDIQPFAEEEHIRRDVLCRVAAYGLLDGFQRPDETTPAEATAEWRRARDIGRQARRFDNYGAYGRVNGSENAMSMPDGYRYTLINYLRGYKIGIQDTTRNNVNRFAIDDPVTAVVASLIDEPLTAQAITTRYFGHGKAFLHTDTGQLKTLGRHDPPFLLADKAGWEQTRVFTIPEVQACIDQAITQGLILGDKTAIQERTKWDYNSVDVYLASADGDAHIADVLEQQRTTV